MLISITMAKTFEMTAPKVAAVATLNCLLENFLPYCWQPF